MRKRHVITGLLAVTCTVWIQATQAEEIKTFSSGEASFEDVAPGKPGDRRLPEE